MTNQSHVYLRDLESPEGSSLAQLARWIPFGATVLELGPASGHFTRYMAETLGCTVDAVERDPAMAELARPWCRRLVLANLDTFSLQEALCPGGYQIVVMADVLEHLRKPERLLRQLHELLSPDGQILISIPNVAYAGLVASLLSGEFAYRDEGLLDRTHLRFFTRTSIADLLGDAGFFPWAWQAVYRPLGESEFATRMEALSPAIVEAIEANPYSLCYQWLVSARLEPPSEQPYHPPPCHTDTFPLRVFWAESGQDYTPDRSAVAWGEIGRLRQTVRVPLPKSPVAELRLRLADRPGFVHLSRVRLVAADASPVWTWTWTDGIAKLASSWDGLYLCNHEQHAVAILHGPESWLQLAAADCSAAQFIELELGWPLSGDYIAARNGWNLAVASLEEELKRMRAMVGERDELLDLRTRQIVEREELIAERDRMLALRTVQLEQRDRDLATLAQQVEERDRLIAEMRSVGWWVRRSWNWILNSR